MFTYFISFLTIFHFRCICDVTIEAIDGANLLYGGNDTGKTTVLDAIALAALLDNSIQLVDSDFFEKEVGEGIRISVTIACKPIQGGSSLGGSEFLNSGVASNNAFVSNFSNAEIASKKFKLTVRGTSTMKLKYTVSEVNGMRKSEVETVLNAFAETRIISNAKSGDHLFENAHLKSKFNLEHDSTDSQKEVVYVVKQKKYVPLLNQPVLIGDLNNSYRGMNLPLISETSADKVVDGLNFADLKLRGGV